MDDPANDQYGMTQFLVGMKQQLRFNFTAHRPFHDSRTQPILVIGKPFTEYRMIEVQKGVTDGGYTEVILPKGFDIKTAKVVIKGAYNLLSAKKNAGEMSCG